MLAKICGLAGNGVFEQAQADSIIKLVNEMERSIAPYLIGMFGFAPKSLDMVSFCYYLWDFGSFLDSIENLHKFQNKTFTDIFVPVTKKYMTLLEKYASKASASGFLLDSGVTYADFALANTFDYMKSMHPELFTQYYHIEMITQRVFKLPKLQWHLNHRPAFHEIFTKKVAKSTNNVIEKTWKWIFSQLDMSPGFPAIEFE